jgi:S-adenosylmethionine decarboxylase
MKHFGEHLMIDGYGGSHMKLNDESLIFRCLNELPEKLKMTKLSDPQVCLCPGNGVKDPGGWSGFVIIAESHISIHTFPTRGFISVDAYTCKNGMEKDAIVSYFTDIFELQDTELNFVIRGKNYPDENRIA